MTWGEFIEWAEEQGVKPEDEISYIDFSLDARRVDRYDDGSLKIT